MCKCSISASTNISKYFNHFLDVVFTKYVNTEQNRFLRLLGDICHPDLFTFMELDHVFLFQKITFKNINMLWKAKEKLILINLCFILSIL